MGPILIFDKSALESFSKDEAVWLDNFFMTNIAPLFFIEVLADLEKEVRERLLKILTPEQKQKLQNLRRRPPGPPPGPPPRNPDGRREGDRPPGKPRFEERPEDDGAACDDLQR